MGAKTSEIQDGILKHFFDKHNCRYGCMNFSGSGFQECDVIAVTKSMIVTEFEVKISRADFKKDFKKGKHQYLSGKLSNDYRNIPNRFFFVCPTGLIKVEEVPEHAGLIYVKLFTLTDQDKRHFEIELIKPAPLIHRDKAGPELIFRICQSLTQRMIFGCALMTYRNKRSWENYFNRLPVECVHKKDKATCPYPGNCQLCAK